MKFSYLKAGRSIVNILVADKTFDYLLEGSLTLGIIRDEDAPLTFHTTYSRSGTAVIIRPDRFGL